MFFRTLRFTILFLTILLADFCNAQDDHKVRQYKKDSLNKIIFDKNLSIKTKVKALDILNEIDISFDEKTYNEVDRLIFDKRATVIDKINLHGIKGNALLAQLELLKAEIELKKAYDFYKSNEKKVDKNKSIEEKIDKRFFEDLSDALEQLDKKNEALKISLEAKYIFELEKDFVNLGNIHLRLGIIYIEQLKKDESIKHFQDALAIGKKINNFILQGEAIKNLALVKSYENKTYEANILMEKALAIFDSIQEPFLMNDTKCYLANGYDAIGKHDEAEVLFKDAMKYFENSGFKSDYYVTSIDYGYHFFYRGNYQKAIEHCTEAKTYFIEKGIREWTLSACNCLYESAKGNQDYKLALQYFKEFTLQKDSLLNEKNIEELTAQKKDFEFEKEKQTIALENAMKMEQEKAFQKYLGIGIALLGGLLFFSYRAYRIQTKANTTITAQKDQLEKFNAVNENLIYTLSHDIKEPMMGLQFLLNKLKSDELYIERAKESINDQVTSINSIVSNLLQLKKTAGSNIDEKVAINAINETAELVLKELNYKISDKTISIQNNILSSPAVTLPISSQKLYITLLNLISNAIKYTPEGGTIEVFTKSDGIYVKDNGPGINTEIMNKIGREYISNNKKSGGSGMGLMLVSSMLNESKMKLIFENVEGGCVVGIVTC